MKKFLKFLLILSCIVIFCLTAPFVIYTKCIPAVVKSKPFLEFVQKKAYETLNLDVVILEPELKTGLDNSVGFKFKELRLAKNNKALLYLKNFDADITIFFGKKVRINSLFADYIFADINGLIDAFPQSDDEQELFVDFFHSVLFVKNLQAKYDISQDAVAMINVKDAVINASEDNKKVIRFDFLSEISKNNKKISVSAKDNDSVYIADDNLYIDNIWLNIDKSKVLFNLKLDSNYSYQANVYSKNFHVNDIVTLINSKLLDDATAELLTYFNDIKGFLDFNIKIENNELSGNIDIKNIFFKLKYLENMPVMISDGDVSITKDEIKLLNFKGYYNNKKANKLDFAGSIKDYWKSFDTNITGNALVTNDFAKNYLSKIIGYPVEIMGSADTRIIVKSKYNKVDMLWLYRFTKGNGFLIGGETFGSLDKERALASNMHLKGNILNIEDLNYIVGTPKELNYKYTPILSFYGNVDLARNGELLNFGFKIPKPLTSNFINLLAKQNIFRRGTISGNMEYITKGKTAYLKGDLAMEKVGVPSQRMFIRNAKLSAKNDLINFSSEGKYKRSDYKISGDIKNRVELPVVVKNLNLTVDNIDVEKFMAAANNQNNVSNVSLSVDNTEELDEVPTFDLSFIVVENGKIDIVKGFYKDIKFADLVADMTFDKNQILQIASNRFEFAKGHSGAKIVCDLKNQLYSVKLGVKEVDSDLIASTLLGLQKEISGKASGFINLNTDKTFKLNGQMKFNIKNGSIAKIGLFEYVLKFTSVFRNPIVSLSPSTIADFVNVPNGDFDIIKGSLDIANNEVKHISITSSAPQMASYIAGNYNLENGDAALRIYIKFSNKRKGFYGALRNISLNSIANRVPFGAKSSNNYYEREIEKIPVLPDAEEKDCQIFLTKVDGIVESNNFISFLKKLK